MKVSADRCKRAPWPQSYIISPAGNWNKEDDAEAPAGADVVKRADTGWSAVRANFIRIVVMVGHCGVDKTTLCKYIMLASRESKSAPSIPSDFVVSPGAVYKGTISG